jgi:hypothetical protein
MQQSSIRSLPFFVLAAFTEVSDSILEDRMDDGLDFATTFLSLSSVSSRLQESCFWISDFSSVTFMEAVFKGLPEEMLSSAFNLVLVLKASGLLPTVYPEGVGVSANSF